MKTTRHLIWMHFLLIGISAMLNVGCGKVDYIKEADFYFTNNTDHSITYKQGFEKYNLKPNSTIVINKTQSSSKDVNSSYDVPFFDENGSIDPFFIKFDNTKCLLNTPDTPHSLLNINSYQNDGKIGERKYQFTYTFTEEDYERAIDCK
ncbi:hypothetical protein [Pedobacter endophyticus]|uniref:Uncharacterized protein n=1 Tax=Pedobacter endophyticus TaxID=2789740 RepID=A0A7S9PZM3_9SPHI|nr:hypothetical protein [Pedobacter endophyticus]QPH39817.1 hypothetical protein IZT61_00595 [Pedobacter endophyticus]